jgi:hypothetical protein
MILERIVTGAIFGIVTWLTYQCLVVAVLYIAQFVYILMKRPYADRNWRPATNMVITTLVLLIYFLVNFTDNEMLEEYGPLAILGLLAVCLVYSTILLVIDLKSSFTNMCL